MPDRTNSAKIDCRQGGDCHRPLLKSKAQRSSRHNRSRDDGATSRHMNASFGEANMSYIEILAARVEAPGMPDIWYAPDRNRARAAKAQANRKRMLALAMIASMLGLMMIVATPRMGTSQ